MSIARSRSRKGCCADELPRALRRARCSGRVPGRPRSGSSAARRSSSSRGISTCAKGSWTRSASAGPRQRARASRSRAAASSGAAGAPPRPAPRSGAGRARRAQPGSGNPARCVTITSCGASALRSCETWNCRALRDGLGRLRAPELVDQPVCRDDLVRAREQDGEQRPLPGAAERERTALLDDLERSQNAELHLFSSTQPRLRGASAPASTLLARRKQHRLGAGGRLQP